MESTSPGKGSKPVTETGMRPAPDATSIGFWEAAGRHELTLARCAKCAEFSFPPPVVCPRCGSTDPDWEWARIPSSGTLRTWTVVRQSFLPAFVGLVPYTLVDVELHAGEGIRVVGRLLNDSGAPLSIGAAMRVVFDELDEGIAIPAFERMTT